METQANKEFFISYTHADQRWAEWIAWQLEAAGYTTMIQAWDFVAGNNFVDDMDTAARQATRTIAVLSPDYLASQFPSWEWKAAFKRDPRGEMGLLVPVRVRPCDVEGLLGQVVYIDLVDQDDATARASLLQGVKQIRSKPSIPPTFPSTQHTTQAPASPPFPGSLPAVWNIPYPRNPYFTGREELLQRLAASLRAGETVGISQPQAVSGLGGVGKTQIALEYVYRYYQDYDAVLWTRADTQEALISGFVVFAGLLQLPEREERDQLKIVQAVKYWLTTHTRWLLLLDNADDLTLMRAYLPPAGRGHILLTTRASNMGRVAYAIEVDALDSERGALFLLRRTGRVAADALLEQAQERERAIAMQISQELGGLPLALDQAGAHIEETQCSLADYLPLYRSQRAALLTARGGLVPDHPEPVATTWSLSFAQVEQRSPVAADLLRVCAFLHPCIGYLGHPFEKVTPWAFTTLRFLSVRWHSAIDRGGEWFSYIKKTGVYEQQTIRKGMHRLQERSATDRFSHDAPSWMDLVPQLSSQTRSPASGCPAHELRNEMYLVASKHKMCLL